MPITPLRVGSRGESERRDASPSERIPTQLIQSLGLSPFHSDPAERRLHAELLSLSRERDPELLGEGLLALAGRLERKGQEARAEIVYEAVPGELERISRRAEARLSALRGGGSFGARFEVQARHFLREATDPTMIAGMGAAGLVSSVVRFGALSRLATRPAGCFTRGFGARFGAGATALIFEAPAFTAAVHGAQALLGRPQELHWNGLGRELASGYLLIGALRLSGGATQAFARRYVGTGPIPVGQRLGLSLLEQGGALGAILAAHRAEQGLGLRPAVSGGSQVFDAMATLLHFRVGSRLAEGVLGSGYRRAMREMQARGQAVESNSIGDGIFPTGPRLAFAAAASGRRRGSAFEPAWPHILQMSTQPPPRKSDLPPRPNGGAAAASEAGAGRVSQVSALPSVAGTLAKLRTATPRTRARMLRDVYEGGRLASLALEAEFQAQRSHVGVAKFAAARRRLQVLEAEFESFVASESGKTPPELRWQKFQQWQNELYPTDSAGLGRVQQIARAMGLPDLFAFKAEGINLKARVRRDSEAADYYHDLFLVRDFLRRQGLNRVEVGNEDGIFLSNLLLQGDGNCVTLSLLFAHFAARMGRPLEMGLLPRHTYLVTKRGGAIDGILDFGMVVAKPYLARAIGPESKPLSAQHLFTAHLLNLGKLGVDMENYSSAETMLSLARGLLPNSPRSYLQLGRMHQRRGEAEAAYENFRKVHELHPQDMHRYNSLRFRAWEKIAAREYREAEGLLRRMNDLQPSDLDVLRALQLVYERSGRLQAAQEMEGLIEVMAWDLPAD